MSSHHFVIPTEVEESPFLKKEMSRDVIPSLPAREGFALPVHVALSEAAPFSALLDMTNSNSE